MKPAASTSYHDLVADIAAKTPTERAERFRQLELAERQLAAEKAAIVAAVDHHRDHHLDGHRSVAGWWLRWCIRNV